jgi:hypothetical protein
MLFGSELMPLAPICRPRIGTAAASISAVDAVRLPTGWRRMRSTIRRHIRPSADSDRPRLRAMTGTRSELTRSPNRPSSAGSSVSAHTIETIPTTIAPSARLRRICVGTNSIPNIAITNVLPLSSTARLAVAPARAIESSSVRPWVRSSR